MEALRRHQIELTKAEMGIIFSIYVCMLILSIVAALNNGRCIVYLSLALLFSPPIANIIISLFYKAYLLYEIIKVRYLYTNLLYEEKFNVEQGLIDIINGKESIYSDKARDFVNKI